MFGTTHLPEPLDYHAAWPKFHGIWFSCSPISSQKGENFVPSHSLAKKMITHLNDSNSNGFTPNGTRGYPEVQKLTMSKLIKEMQTQV